MEFFLYFVFWPLLAGSSTIYLALFYPQWFYYFVILWGFAWVVWPMGYYRRLFMNRIIASFKEEAELNHETPSILPLLGMPVVMLLSFWVGLQVTPVLLEHVGVDVTARLEEIRQDVERQRNQPAPALPPQVDSSRGQSD